jgi:2-polyprenyl-6-methoxyphenol hydroxylase-like FAD-dependent oxidoreductase
MARASQRRGDELSPLIVGAGPTGLAAALFLAQAGLPVRVIDRAAQPSRHSKALAVSPRTLELLQSTGVTDELLRHGEPIRGVRFWRGAAPLAAIDFAALQHPFPYMLALSQATTEAILEAALRARGGTVERGVELVECRAERNAEVTLLRGGAREQLSCSWLLAADGAHSAVRNKLEVAFEGSTFDRRWQLADLPLATTLAPDQAHVFFLPAGGFHFLLRVVGHRDAPTRGHPIWRVMTNLPQIVSPLPQAEISGPAVWSSSLAVSHRVVERLRLRSVYFAGDAAHLHAPIGARGMNLGIEDAWVFAQLVRRGELQRYDKLRRRVDADTVRRVRMFSRMARGESFASRLARDRLLPRFAPLQKPRRRLIEAVTGLDHPLPAL